MVMNIRSAATHNLAKKLAAREQISVTEDGPVTAEQRLTIIQGIADRFTDQMQLNSGPSLWQVNKG